MAKIAAGAALTAFIVLAVATDALAQIACAPREDILKKGSQDFGQVPMVRGLDSNGHMVEILVSPTGEWSLIVSYPDGNTCVYAVGQAFDLIKVEPAGMKL